MLAGRITLQFTIADCHIDFLFFKRSNTGFNLNNDRVLIRVFPLECPSQRVVHGSLRSRSLHLSHFFLLVRYLGDRTMFKSI